MFGRKNFQVGEFVKIARDGYEEFNISQIDSFNRHGDAVLKNKAGKTVDLFTGYLYRDYETIKATMAWRKDRADKIGKEK